MTDNAPDANNETKILPAIQKSIFLYCAGIMNKKDTKAFKKLELRGIDPRTFRMQSGRSTTELQPHI